MTESDVSADLSVLRTSTSDLLAGLAAEQWSDADVGAPSLLPGWTRGHVLTHIARNADSIARTLAGALRGEIVARYPDGPAGRERDIEAGAQRHANELVADVVDSAGQLDRVLGAVADANGWDLTTDKGVPARRRLHMRLDEVEIHRVDLAGAYTADRWPPPLVSRLLPGVAASLAGRVDGPVRVEVVAGGSLAPQCVGSVWAVPGRAVPSDAVSGDAVDVRGPDWAVLAWLVGRPEATLSRLSAVPALAPWN